MKFRWWQNKTERYEKEREAFFQFYGPYGTAESIKDEWNLHCSLDDLDREIIYNVCCTMVTLERIEMEMLMRRRTKQCIEQKEFQDNY